MIGGIQSALKRHKLLLSDEYEFVSIALESSKSESYWCGKTQFFPESNVYQITASDLKTDHQWSNSSSIRNIRFDQKFKSYADHITKILKEHKIDLIHVFGLFHQRGLLASYVSGKTGIPYVLNIRGSDVETRMFDASISAIDVALRSAKALLMPSEDARNTVEQVFQPQKPMHVIPNHLDPSQFSESGPVNLPLLQGRRYPVIGFFGKFRRVTGLSYLLEAFERLNQDSPHLLLLVGSFRQQEVEYFDSLINKMSSAANIVRVPFVPHETILEYYRLCDLVAFPSLSDSSPNKVLEAMYARVPIVSTRVGGIPELVKHEEEAILVPSRDSSVLYAAIKTVLQDESLASRITENAYQKVTGTFTPDNEKALWLEFYREVLD